MITSECNLNCKYCYLQKHQDDLYPKCIREHKTILENMRKLLNSFKLNNYKIHNLELFSGEIWHTNFGIDVLTDLLEFYKYYKFSDSILIPSNMSFIAYDNYTKKIQYLIDEFKTLDVNLIFSASVDGYILEEINRPNKDVSIHRDEIFYDKLGVFAKRNKIGFHPMVSSISIDKWVENYDWYKEFLKKHDIFYNLPMMLEVRDDNWSDESISAYCKFLKYIIDDVCNNNLENLYNFLFCRKLKGSHYTNIALFNADNRITCSIQRGLHIRLGDLAIIPCHRLCYDRNIFGWFKIDEEGNIDIKANNVDLAGFIYQINPNIAAPSCDICKYKHFCLKGCLGSQYETSRDLTLPCDSVCKLFQTKITFLYHYYSKLGLWDYILEYHPDNTRAMSTIDELAKVFKGMPNG